MFCPKLYVCEQQDPAFSVVFPTSTHLHSSTNMADLTNTCTEKDTLDYN